MEVALVLFLAEPQPQYHSVHCKAFIKLLGMKAILTLFSWKREIHISQQLSLDSCRRKPIMLLENYKSNCFGEDRIGSLNTNVTLMWSLKKYLTKVSAHCWAVWVVTCLKLCKCRFSLSSAGMFRAWDIEAATSVIFHGLTRIAPAPKDCAAPANYTKKDAVSLIQVLWIQNFPNFKGVVTFLKSYFSTKIMSDVSKSYVKLSTRVK